jgi:ABC-type glycerol-3-phosphate transport system substrate-binding protein
MTKLRTLALAAFASLVLAACAGGLHVVSASSDAVTIRHSPDRNSDAESRAMTECQNFGKKARLRSSHSDASTERFSIFDCVPM